MENPIAKKKREKSNKKWSDKEVEKLLNILEESDSIETPTAQLFYKKFLQANGVETTWNLVKWRVRNLRTSFNKAEEWRKSTGAGLMESGEGLGSVQSKLLKMCPFYLRLKEIFGGKVSEDSEQYFIDSDIAEVNVELLTSTEAIEELECVEFETSSPAIEMLEEAVTLPQSFSTHQASATSTSKNQKANEFAQKMRQCAPKSGVSQLASLQSERIAIMKSKISLDKEKFEKEMELSEKRLKLEKDMALKSETRSQQELALKQQELELKRLEIEKDERLRKIQMEKHERIAMYQLKLKYDFNK